MAKFSSRERIIPITFDFNESLIIQCNRHQTVQCFINLINNSCDAIYETYNPWITVQASKDSKITIIKFTDSGKKPEDLKKT